MKTKVKITTEEEILIKYFIQCPECDKVIKSSSNLHVIINFRIHYKLKHPKKKWEEIIIEGMEGLE